MGAMHDHGDCGLCCQFTSKDTQVTWHCMPGTVGKCSLYTGPTDMEPELTVKGKGHGPPRSSPPERTMARGSPPLKDGG